MAVTFEHTIAGYVAYLEGKRNGSVLTWYPGTAVRFGFNRPGSTLSRVDAPERFGGTPTSLVQFKAFAHRFADAGVSRRRHPASRSERMVISRELARRRAQARSQDRLKSGKFK